MLGKVVVDNQGILALLHEVFAHGAARVRRQVLHGHRIGGVSRHHDGVLHGSVFFQCGHYPRYFRCLLPDGDVDTDEVAALLIDYGIQGNRRLTRGAVADDKLSLPSTQGNQAVDGFDTGLHRCVHRLAAGNVGRYPLHGHDLLGLDGPLAVEGITQGIDHPPDKGLAHRHLGDTPRAAHLVPLLDGGIIAHDNSGDAIFFQVQGNAHDVIGKLQQLVIFSRRQPVNAGDAVANLDDGADIDHLNRFPELLNLLFDNRNDVLPSYGHFKPPPSSL